MSNQLRQNKNTRFSNKELYLQFDEILRTLLNKKNEEFHINKIVREIDEKYNAKERTGLKHKPGITNSIEILKKIGLIEKKKVNKQKIIIILSDLGKEVAKVTIDLQRYNDSYFGLLKSLNEKLLFIKGYQISFIDRDLENIGFSENPSLKVEVENQRHRLKGKGWARDEICFYNKIRTNLLDFKNILDASFFNIFLSRYAKIKRDFKIENELLLKYLHYLIKKSIDKKIDFMLENYESEIYGYSNIRVIYSTNTKNVIESIESTGGYLQYFEDLFGIFFRNMVTFSLEKEIREMLFSFLELIELPIPQIDISHIDGLKTLIKSYDAYSSRQNLTVMDKNKINVETKTAKLLLDVLLKYAERKNVEVKTFVD